MWEGLPSVTRVILSLSPRTILLLALGVMVTVVFACDVAFYLGERDMYLHNCNRTQHAFAAAE